MKKILLVLLMILAFTFNAYAVDNWDKTQPAGTASAADIDALIIANNNSVDRLFSNYRSGCKLTYASASTITVGTGTIICNNSAGTVRRLRANSSTVTMAWSDIDTSSEAASTTYYVYAVGDTDAATFTVKLSTNATSPTGITYYKRLGSFYNNASSNITQISNDNESYKSYVLGQGSYYKIDTGTVALAANTGENISFTFTFAAAPVLTIGYLGATTDNQDTFMTAISTTGATLYNESVHANTTHWMAIGQVLAQ